MNKNKFWNFIDQLDWSKEGNDEKVIRPVVNALSKLSDKDIFQFNDILAELLYSIDGAAWAKDVYESLDKLSEDDFLYTRCVAVANGKDYYYRIRDRQEKLDSDLEFESLLEIPERAWQKKHNNEDCEYDYVTSLNYETGNNKKNW